MEIFIDRCPWYVAGPLIGLLVVGLFWAINKPLGALGAYIDSVNWAWKRDTAPSWRVLFLVGVVMGGLLSALITGSYVPTVAYGSFDHVLGASLGTKAAILLTAGGLIGYGARLGGGCTSGHGMCGMALGSPASIVATMTFMGMAVVTANLLAIWIGG
jgi:uncharacterized membrane protein YedE/YeeE